jgi:hypothetical protein
LTSEASADSLPPRLFRLLPGGTTNFPGGTITRWKTTPFHGARFLTPLRLLSDGYPAISYYNATAGDLKFTQWDGSSWSIQTAASTGDVGRYSRNAFNTPAALWVIAYDDTTNTNGMYVRQMSDKNWDTPTIIENMAGDVAYTDLVFNPASGRPAVTYYDTFNGDLRLAYGNNAAGTAWTHAIVAASGTKGLYTNLHYVGQDAFSHPIWDIVYYKKSGTSSIELAQGASGTITAGVWDGFTVSTLETDGGANVVAAWLSTTLTIAYVKTDGTGLKIADH